MGELAWGLEFKVWDVVSAAKLSESRLTCRWKLSQ